MFLAGLAMLLLALAAIGMVLAFAGLDQDNSDNGGVRPDREPRGDRDVHWIGDRQAHGVPAAVADRHGHPGRTLVSH